MYKVSLRSSKKSQFVRIALCVMLLAVAFLIAPAKAFARDLSIDTVNIDATVQKDGTLHVVETRTFYFRGSFHGVYWNLPVGKNKYNGQNVEVTLLQLPFRISRERVSFTAKTQMEIVPAQTSIMFPLYQAIC